MGNEFSKASKAYRADINFLRALAVLSVVLYHFKVELFSGGFLGVDIFFVISGYLMTKIIVGALSRENFSFYNFYLARINRIVPALAVLLVVLLCLGWFILLPSEYRLLSKHSGASIGFISNYLYIGESGYFDTQSHQKWLLHTWSLSAEWQFYILYPLFIVIAHKLLGLNNIKKLLLFLAISSFLIMLYMGMTDSKYLYFGLTSRVWEMLCGGLVFLVPVCISELKKKYLFWGGTSLISFSLFVIDSQVDWPGVWSLLPILGVVSVLYSQQNTNFLVSNPLVKYVGLTSYSIYLWHWPVVVAIAYFDIAFNIGVVTGGILLSGILGGVSYRFIEQSFTSLSASKIKQLIIVSSVGTFALLLSVLVFLNNGFSIDARFDNDVLVADREYLNRDPRKSECLVEHVDSSPHCIYGDRETEVALVLLGDSHASAVVNSVAEAAKPYGSVLFIAYAGCVTIQGVRQVGKSDNSCFNFVNNEINYIKRNYPNVPVLVVNRWSYYLSGKLNENRPTVYFDDNAEGDITASFADKLANTVCYLEETNPVSLLMSFPEYTTEVPRAVAKLLLNKQLLMKESKNLNISIEAHRDRNKDVSLAFERAKGLCNVKVYDPTTVLCNENSCPSTLQKRPMYYDDNHLSEYGNRQLKPLFKNIIEESKAN